MRNVKLDGERIYLRSITYDDTDLIVRWRNQENVRKYFFYTADFTSESHEKWMKNKVETGEVEQFIVCMKDNDRPVGCTYLRDVDYDNNKAEYGVFLGEEDIRGMGIGKEALEITVRFAFDVLKLHRVYARVKESNKASLYSFLHTGFEKEAVFRESMLCDGEYVNVVIVGRLNN